MQRREEGGGRARLYGRVYTRIAMLQLYFFSDDNDIIICA